MHDPKPRTPSALRRSGYWDAMWRDFERKKGIDINNDSFNICFLTDPEHTYIYIYYMPLPFTKTRHESNSKI